MAQNAKAPLIYDQRDIIKDVESKQLTCTNLKPVQPFYPFAYHVVLDLKAP